MLFQSLSKTTLLKWNRKSTKWYNHLQQTILDYYTFLFSSPKMFFVFLFCIWSNSKWALKYPVWGKNDLNYWIWTEYNFWWWVFRCWYISCSATHFNAKTTSRIGGSIQAEGNNCFSLSILICQLFHFWNNFKCNLYRITHQHR